MEMNEEIRDPELERVGAAWQPPEPSLDLQARILHAYGREFEKRRRINLVAVAAAILAVVLVLGTQETRLQPARRISAQPETVTPFFPLMDAPPPLGRGVLVRALVPVSMMRAAGLPVREEGWNGAIQADILIGEEGLPRAIRFVRARP
jgi:hypothetical protein